MTEAAVALGQPQIMLPLLDALIYDPTGTELERTPARMIVNHDEDGNRVESLHAVPLAQGDGWSARLHVWSAGQSQLTEDTHNHTADFGSAVLTGAFRDTLYSPAAHGEGEKRYEYLNDGQRTGPVREVVLMKGPSRIIPAGEAHTMDHRVVHSANVRPDGPGGISATVVVRRPRKQFGNAYTVGERTGSPPWVEPVDGVAALKKVRTALENS
ncbi:hypothetical protein BKA01_003361 [Pseudonocardia eucalypti]|uniref:hypothetical protein n=1 Tax=Pseudonocardia eucalypti TaxID=648755 RepID=UPI001615282F|nr:hypothetical protein [Pseudonocardia eucalypti]